jgi:hypothetical protein
MSMMPLYLPYLSHPQEGLSDSDSLIIKSIILKNEICESHFRSVPCPEVLFSPGHAPSGNLHCGHLTGLSAHRYADSSRLGSNLKIQEIALTFVKGSGKN